MNPFDAASPWNTPLAANPVIHPNTSALVARLATLPITCDPDAYTIPVYPVDGNTFMRQVTGTGHFSDYPAGEASRVGYGQPWSTYAPIPVGATGGAGSDGQVSFWSGSTLWEFWQFAAHADGTHTATNGWRTSTGVGYLGRFADGKAGRGCGTPYLAGLVTRNDYNAGAIKHALAFGYKSPSRQYVHPGSKSDGAGTTLDIPEGMRLQLDPTQAIASPYLPGTPARAMFDLIVNAMKTYGMIVVDNSGSTKVYLEHRQTAKWDASITRHVTEQIPRSALRVVIA